MSATVLVCTVCRRTRDDLPDGYDQPGAALAEALRRRLDLPVEGVECLAVCKRPCTVTFTAPGKWTYVLGDIDGEQHLDDLAEAAKAYARSETGIVPWKERPACVRKGVIARIPPLAPARLEAAE